MNNDYALYLLSIPVGEYRAIRKALKVLLRAGIGYDAAISVLVEGHKERSKRYVA